MTIIDELITVISFKKGKGSDKELKQYQQSIGNLRKQALLAGAAFAGLGIAATKIVQGVDQQAKFARGVGLSFESLRKLQFAAKKAGASTGELNAFVGNLARTIVSLQPGQFNQTLVRLGVAARDAAGNIRPLDKVILDISSKLQKLNAIRRLQFSSQFGGSLNIANFLGQGVETVSKDMQEAVKIGFVIPERLTGQFAAFFDDSLLKLRSTITGFTEVMIGALLPSIIKVIDELDTWILKNKELLATDIGDFLKGAGDGIVFFGKGVKLVLDGITELVKLIPNSNSGLNQAKILGYAAAAAMTALAVATAAAAAEWLALAAAITAILAIIPNIKNISNFVKEGIEQRNAAFKGRDIFKGIGAFDFAGRIDAATAADPFSAVAPAGTTNNNASRTTTQNNTFNISGAQSPSETARRVKEELELSTALQSAHPGFNRGMVG